MNCSLKNLLLAKIGSAVLDISADKRTKKQTDQNFKIARSGFDNVQITIRAYEKAFISKSQADISILFITDIKHNELINKYKLN